MNQNLLKYFTDYELKIIAVWDQFFTAFNSIQLDGDIWKITGCDYIDAVFFTKDDLMDCIATDVKESLLVYAINGELGEINQTEIEETYNYYINNKPIED